MTPQHAHEPTGQTGPAGNQRHQAATQAAAELVDQLRTDIHAQTAVLRASAGHLTALVDTRQAGALGFQSPELRAALDEQAAADRAAARGIPTHSSRAMLPGLGWIRADRTNGGAVPGVHEAPVSITAVTAYAEAVAVLRHWSRHIGPAFVAGAAQQVPGHRGRMPVGHPAADAGVGELLDWLDLLVDAWTDRPGLQAVLRDLDHLEHTIRQITDGPAATAHPEPCPWCGRKSLVIHHRPDGRRAREKGSRDTAWIRCEGTHPCTCSNEWCPCHRHPIRHRHEWTNSAGTHLSWRQLERDQQHARETAIQETKALDALALIRAMHTPHWTDDDGEAHTHYVEPPADQVPADHVCITSGAHQCEGDHHLVLACVECRYVTDDGAAGWAYWPCPTYQATDLEAQRPSGAE